MILYERIPKHSAWELIRSVFYTKIQMKIRTIGIDIGATKISVGIVENSAVTKELKIPTSAGAPDQQILSEIVSAIEQVAGKDFSGIGIGVPGLIDEEEGIVFDLLNIPSWKEVHLKKQLEEHFQKPVRVTNDANVFAMGEKIFGKGKPYKNMVGVTLGSGLGMGIISNHQLHSGIYSGAGELGVVPYLNKTVEDYCSGKFFRDEYGLTGGDAYKMAQKGDEKALRIFEEFGTHLGNALKTVLFILAPEAIFLGGSISRSFHFFENSLMKSLEDFPFKKIREQLVVLPSDMSNISILGAAALVLSEEDPKTSLNK